MSSIKLSTNKTQNLKSLEYGYSDFINKINISNK